MGARQKVVAAVGLVGAATVASVPVAATPAPPASCTFELQSDGFHVAWQAAGDNDSYIVRRSVGEISSNREPWWRARTTSTSHVDAVGGRRNNTLPTEPIQYFVSTKSGGGESAPQACALTAPTNVKGHSTPSESGRPLGLAVTWAVQPAAHAVIVRSVSDPATTVARFENTGQGFIPRPDAQAEGWTLSHLSVDPRTGQEIESERVRFFMPEAPELTASTVTDASGDLELSWNAIDNATHGYRILLDGQPYPVALGREATSLRIANPVAAGRHAWAIQAVAAGGYASPASNVVTITVDEVAGPEPTVDPSPNGKVPEQLAFASSETYETAQINGRWELVEASSADAGQREATHLTSISVRYDLAGGLPAITDQVLADVAAQGFDTVRLPLHWSDVEPSRGHYNQALLADVDDFIKRAGEADLGVILDPLHLGGGAESHFWIPKWAWELAWADPGAYGGLAKTANPADDTHPDDSTEVLSWDDPTAGGQDLALGYLSTMLTRYRDNPTVVAFELVNEPHPVAGNAWANTSDIADLQADWVSALRTIDADKPIIVTGFFGGYLSDAEAFRQAFITADGEPRWQNLIFTAHTYYSGIADPTDDDANDDGYGDTNLAQTWKRGAKRGTRVESFSSSGCYGQTGSSQAGQRLTCEEPSADVRSTAVANIARSIEAQDDVAQAAGMPLFVGEFGAHPQRYITTSRLHGWAGWGHADLMLCDQVTAMYRVHGTRVSYSVWDLTTGGFGTYDLSNRSWNSLGQQLAPNAGCVPR